jgi:hypothetical protein
MYYVGAPSPRNGSSPNSLSPNLTKLIVPLSTTANTTFRLPAFSLANGTFRVGRNAAARRPTPKPNREKGNHLPREELGVDRRLAGDDDDGCCLFLGGGSDGGLRSRGTESKSSVNL